MAPSAEQLRDIANQAEADLNTYEAKTGAGKTSVNDEAGVDSRVETKFPGAEVKYGQDLSTNASFNKRIPPEEGGELDARGRYVVISSSSSSYTVPHLPFLPFTHMYIPQGYTC